MYTVMLDNITIHDPSQHDSTRIVMDGVVNKQVNKADSFEFTIYPDNVGYSSLDMMVSWISVFKDGDLIFHGRPLTEDTGWENEKHIVCEGDLAILNDTVLRPYSFSGTLLQYMQMLINQHNAQVGADKQFTIRTVDNPTVSMVRSTGDYKQTIQEIFEKIVDYFGGYIVTEFENGTRYISYVTDSINGTNQTLEIGKNILDFQRSISSEALATALIPLGATDDATGDRLTIEDVNSGSDYITAPEASTKGLIYTTYTFDDITDANELLTKARAVLTDLVRVAPRIELSAVDLSEAGYNIDSIGFFEYVTVQDTSHSASGQYLITERVYNISAPERDTVTFGSEEKTISGETARSATDIAGMTDAIINKAVDIVLYQTDLLKGGNGGHMVIGTNSDGEPSELYFMDTDSTATARSVLRINSSGIGFSTTGFNGPYGNAWTIDGKLNADYLYTGIIQDQAGNNSWNLATGAFVITNGSINITTTSETTDKIILSHNEWTHSLSPLEWRLTNTSTGRELLAQAGAIYGYDVSDPNNRKTTLYLSTNGTTLQLGNYQEPHADLTQTRVAGYIDDGNGGTIPSWMLSEFTLRCGASNENYFYVESNMQRMGIYAGGASSTPKDLVWLSNNVLGIRASAGADRHTELAATSATLVSGRWQFSQTELKGFNSSSTQLISLNCSTPHLSLTNGTQSIVLQPTISNSAITVLNGTSKYTFLMYPDSNGAGRIVLGDGAGTLWRTELTNSGLTFRNSSDVVTAQYPATGLWTKDVPSANMLDYTTFAQETISGSGVITNSTTRLLSPLIPVEPSTAYYIDTGNSSIYVYEVETYSAARVWLGYISFSTQTASFTTGSNVYYVQVLIRKSDNATIKASDISTIYMRKNTGLTGHSRYSVWGADAAERFAFADWYIATINSTSIASMLNSQNTSMPVKKTIIVRIFGDSGANQTLIVNKASDNYGAAWPVGYYSQYRFELSAGTWYLKDAYEAPSVASYWSSGKENCPFIDTATPPNASSYWPTVGMKTPGGQWTAGHLGENLYFVYTATAQIGSTNNSIRYRIDGNAANTSNIERTILTNETGALKPTHVSGGGTMSATTSYKYSGYSFTVPANKYFSVTAQAYYSAVSPSKVCISDSSSAINSGHMQVEGTVDSQNTRARITWTAYASAQTTYYVWAQGATSGTLGIGIDGFYFS